MVDRTIERVWTVYKLTCSVTGRSYIGLTAKKPTLRWSIHKSAARTGFGRKQGMAISAAISKHGPDCFSLEVLSQHSTVEEASSAEIAAIADFNTRVPNGYNVAVGGYQVRSTAYVPSPEECAAISARQLGRVISDESRERMAKSASEKVLSEDHRRKIGDASRGKRKPYLSLAGLLRSRDNITRVRTGKWMARIKISGLTTYIGSYPTKDEAICAYREAKAKRIAELQIEVAAQPPTKKMLRDAMIARDRIRWLEKHRPTAT